MFLKVVESSFFLTSNYGLLNEVYTLFSVKGVLVEKDHFAFIWLTSVTQCILRKMFLH